MAGIESMDAPVPARRGGAGRAARRTVARVIFLILLLVLMAGMVVPFVWMFSVSVGRPSQVFVVPPRWIPSTVQFGAYRRVLLELPFLKWFLNSFKIATLVTIGQLFTCATAAYAFARLRFPGRNVLFLVLLSALMIPVQVTIIPIFVIMRVLNLLDSHLSLILPPLVSAFGVFLLRQFFLTIPKELEDAARIDGAGPLLTFGRIILPLSGGALATLAVLTYNFFWNDYFSPLIFINSPARMTLPLGIGIMAGRYVEAGGMGADAPGIVAAVAMSILPVLLVFLFAQRYLIESITMTGLKT
jgi:ABC-type glycerol-3-phosphate transport system permease component